MRVLDTLVLCEGSTDRDVIAGLLPRVLADLCRPSTLDIQIGEPVVSSVRSFDERFDLLQEIRNRFDFVVVHADGTGDWSREHSRHVQPVVERLAELGLPHPCIAMMPVKETEAWVLADRESAAYVLRCNPDLLAPWPTHPDACEREPDPKACLKRAMSAGFSRRRRVRFPYREFGRVVELSQLERLSSFQRFRSDLSTALASTGFL